MKKPIVSLILAAATLTACSPRPPEHAGIGTTRARIVALMPNVADDLYAVGGGGQLAAVSSFTDDPRAASLPRVADYTAVDTERIVALHPDVAIGIVAQKRLVDPLRRSGIQVVLLHDDAFDDIFTNLRVIGAVSGRSARAAAIVASLQRTTSLLHERTRAFRRRPSVFVVLGSAPIWTAGSSSYIGTLIALAGGTNAAADLRAAYGQYSAEVLLRHQPDVIVADPAVRLNLSLGREPWRSLQAVRAGHVFEVVPASILERPGPRYNDGIRWLIERLTPLAS